MSKHEFKRKFRRAIRKIVHYLPAPFRYSIIRNSLRLDYTQPTGLEFKIADSLEELKDAYRILHQSYVEQGYSKPCTSGMRITKYFALPTTTTLVAKWEGKVVGTMSVIRKSQFGLPIEQAFELSTLEKNGCVVAEVSSLAIDNSFRGNRGSLFLPLCKFFYEYSLNYMNVDKAVIVINPLWRDFYKGVLGFKNLASQDVPEYDFANGAPGVGLWLDIEHQDQTLINMYGGVKKSKNLYSYLCEHKLECFRFPDRTYKKAQDPVMSPEMLSYFFAEKSDVYKNLTELEILTLRSLYPQKEYDLVLPKINPTPENSIHRENQRYFIQAHGQVLGEQGDSNVRIIDASKEGVRVSGEVKINETVKMKIFVSEYEEVNISGVVCWINDDNSTFGVQLTEGGETWDSYIDYLSSDFSKLSMKKAI